MELTIHTPEKEVFAASVVSVIVPGTSGQFEILNNHAPIVSSLSHGQVRISLESGDKQNYFIESGFVEVLNNSVSLLVRGISE